MDILYERCCGLDIHKRTVVACLIVPSPAGRPRKEIRTFGTMTADLLQLSDWLTSESVTHVAMEATGVYWQPVWNVLEGSFTLLLAKARHIQAVPGRKTDVRDGEWIADLLRHGLLRPSFVPDRPQRELRELTRYRTALIRERSAEVNRRQKTLEGANLKLAAVATDLRGRSGQAILAALVAGQTEPTALAELVKRRLRAKLSELERALAGQFDGHQRFLVAQQVAHLASWAGMCPGNHESAGKRQSGRTRKGNAWLRSALTEAGQAAGRTKHAYLGAQYRRLAARRGKKKATIAVGHTILIIAYHLLTEHTTYQDLGVDYLEQRHRHAVERRLVRRLEALGNKVTLEPIDPAA